MRPCPSCGDDNYDTADWCHACGEPILPDSDEPIRTSFGHAEKPVNAQELASMMRRAVGTRITAPPQQSDPGPSQAHPDRTTGGDLEAETRSILSEWVDTLVEQRAAPICLLGVANGLAHVCRPSNLSNPDLASRLREIADLLDAIEEVRG